MIIFLKPSNRVAASEHASLALLLGHLLLDLCELLESGQVAACAVADAALLVVGEGLFPVGVDTLNEALLHQVVLKLHLHADLLYVLLTLHCVCLCVGLIINY